MNILIFMLATCCAIFCVLWWILFSKFFIFPNWNNFTNIPLVDIADRNLNYQHYENFSFIEIYFALLMFSLALFTFIYFW